MRAIAFFITLLLGLLFTSPISGQESVVLVENSEPGMLALVMDHIILVLAVGILILGFGAIANLNYKLIELQKIQALKDLGIEENKVELITQATESFLIRFNRWMWSIVPINKEQSIDMGHDYDGIRELDNRLPPWWLGLMYGSIIFSIVYMVHYHWSGNDWSSIKEYETELVLAEKQNAAYLLKSADNIDESTVVIATDEESLSKGKDIFMSLCAACHGPEGQGLVGPNFADNYWIHGGSINDLFKVIKYGVPEKGMISWRSQLRPSAIQQVSSYILSLEGTNPPNPKAPEGEVYERISVQ